MTDTIDWTGKSGATYRYWFSDIRAPFKDEGGNYMFVREVSRGQWSPIYIGQADSLKARVPQHDRWADAVRAGATHAMSHTNPAGEQERLDEERDLIAYWNPPLNTHHRTDVK
ncbi:MAG: hypothetical protein E7813_06040 [Bradyrhizobium sp.]|uniref:hypothetical protein n=1 Tax=Bradyrhizobium sp. TaxID=376 RepID=UPI0011F4CF71|nr:hypothetical protein [Bradyrhizobium sp.]THD71239.1 MAG: hypothetical protein E7813_06040 [Bradyrhizobium sp.]